MLAGVEMNTFGSCSLLEDSHSSFGLWVKRDLLVAFQERL
jgi:hypothetical protein